MMHNGFGQYGNWFCAPGAFFPGSLGWIVPILFWGVVIYLIVKLFKALFSEKTTTTAGNLDILKERYARGEIQEDEYQRMKTELQ